jgi:hypothetical protein
MAKSTKTGASTTTAATSPKEEDAKIAQYEEKVTESFKPYVKKLFHFFAYLCFIASLLTAMVPESMRENEMVAKVMGWLHVAALNVNNATPTSSDSDSSDADCA